MIVEPYGDLVDEALENFHIDSAAHNLDAFAQQENDEVENDLNTSVIPDENDSDEEQTGTSHSIVSAQRFVVSDDELFASIRSLNGVQRTIFDVVYHWGKTLVKLRNSKEVNKLSPLHIFLTGGGGCGKSHLLITLYKALTKVLMHKGGEPDKPRVLRIAPTGVAAINISGTTIHTALGIHGNGLCGALSSLRMQKLRNLLSEVEAVIIDEISMVSGMLLLNIHLRLCQIIGVDTKVPFAGKTIIACGDLYQLPPVIGTKVFQECPNNMLSKVLKLWKNFKIAELTEVMRQKGDDTFINLLNNIRTGEITAEDEEILKSRFISPDDPSYPHDALHLFAENAPCDEHNQIKLNALQTQLHTVAALDILPPNVPASIIEEARNRKQTETGGLALILKVKIGARVMLTSNIDIDDRLINGQIGTVYNVVLDRNQAVTKIYVKFNDSSAGLSAMSKDSYARIHNVVPITRSAVDIHIHKKITSSPVIKRTQFPLMLAWACTVHKVQGLTLSEVVVSFNLFKQKRFNPGQLYVAMSRVTSLSGLYLVGSYNKNAIIADRKAFDEYERLRSESVFQGLDGWQDTSSFTFNISLFNTRSLRKHLSDIILDKYILRSDLICFTETQLNAGDSVEEINRTMSYIDNYYSFSMLYNNSEEDKYSSLAFACRVDITVDQINCQNRLMIMKVSKPTMLSDTGEPFSCTIAMMYRKNNTPQNSFWTYISNIAEMFKPDLLIGDFNANYFQQSVADKVRDSLPDYTVLTGNENELYHAGGTHIDGGMLDYVLLRKNSAFNLANFYVKSLYFSDHDLVKVEFEFAGSNCLP